MLKITILDSAAELRFRLEGRLSGPWVAELRQCWLTAASTTQGRATILDLAEVDFVDNDGQCLMSQMQRSGVQLLAATPLIKALVDGCGRVEDKPSKADAVTRQHASGHHARSL